MNDAREQYLETALDELYHGGPEPDLQQRILQGSARPVLKLVQDAASPRRRWLWLQAASAVVALGLIGLVVWPRDTALPEKISSSDGVFAVEGDEIQISEGWYLLDTGSPVVTASDGRLEQVSGRVLVKVGDIPDEKELAARKDWLRQNGVEENMLNRDWIKAGGMSICVLVGSAVVNGQMLQAQRETAPKAEEKKGEASTAMTRKDRIDTNLKRLNSELVELKKSSEKNAKQINQKSAMVTMLKTMLKEPGVQSDTKEYDTSAVVDVSFDSASVTDLVDHLKKTSGLLIGVADGVEADVTLELTRMKPLDCVRLFCETAELELLEDGEVLLITDPAAEDIQPDPEALISLDFVKRDIHAVMHHIALRSGLAIVIEGDVDVELTVSFKNVNPREAIRSICKANNLVMIEDGDTIILKKGDGKTGTPSRDVDPEKPISVSYQDKPLSEILLDIQKRSGLDIRNQLSKDYDEIVSLRIDDMLPKALVQMICEDCEVRVVSRGDTLIIRRMLDDMTQPELKAELEAAEAEKTTLDKHVQFLEIAIEGANESGDALAARKAEYERDLCVKQLVDLEKEISELKNVVK